MTIVIFIKIFSPLSRGSLYYVSSDYFFSSTLLFKISLAQEFGYYQKLYIPFQVSVSHKITRQASWTHSCPKLGTSNTGFGTSENYERICLNK
jgi:hypothetical protein